jgi:hypothetical protein
MRSEIINFPVDLLEKPYVEQLRIVFFDGDADAVGVDVIDQYIIGSAKDSQNILLFTFFEIYSVVFHNETNLRDGDHKRLKILFLLQTSSAEWKTGPLRRQMTPIEFILCSSVDN